MESKIVELFGKFAVNIDGKIKSFDTRAEAEIAQAKVDHLEEFTARANAYTKAFGFEGKNAKGKTNIIENFLLWESSPKEDATSDVDALLED